MDTLMDSLMASAMQHENTSDLADSETNSTDMHRFPQNGWKSADIKKCFGYTDDQYTRLYGRVEKAMCQANLIEHSLTGERKTQLETLLNQALPENDVPNVPNSLRLKALQQLASRIKHNVKTKSGRALYRKGLPSTNNPGSRSVTTVMHPQMQQPRVPSAPILTAPNPTVPNQTIPQPTVPNPPPLHTAQPQPVVANAVQPSSLGSMLLLSEREDRTQSTCSLRHIARNVRPGAPISVENLSFEAWKTLLLADGVLRNPMDNASIMWKWGGRHVKVPNDRVLRTVVEFMATRGGFIEFYIKSAELGEESTGVGEGTRANASRRKPLNHKAK
ncbi:MAG: hypothetical protein Q9226_006806 [Calogaya cf. arnoldii]